jgi:peptidoglycan/xylan/chitin deacetylase (PgdA/CDA1 family)
MRGPALAAVSAGAAAVVGAYWGIGLAVSAPGRRLLEPQVLWRARTARPEVALTFDDGPHPFYTERFVEALEGAPSTFFMLGEAAAARPGVVRRVVAGGHEVACHGHTHAKLSRMTPRASIEQIRRGRDEVSEAGGSVPRYYRPAYGVFNLAAWAAAPRLGMRRTLWSVSPGDWEEGATPASIARKVLDGAEPGAIILMHDAGGWPDRPAATLAALPAILDGLRERGLSPVTLSGLVRSAAEGPARPATA